MARISESLYRNLIMSSPIAFCMTDAQGKIQMVNSSFIVLYGYTTDEVVGKTPGFLNPGREAYFENGVYSGEYDRLFYRMKEFMRNPDNSQWNGKVLNRTKNGYLVWVRLKINALYDDEGTLAGFLGATEDVSDEIEAELQIRMETYHAITSLAETRDDETGQHLKRIASYTGIISRRLGMPSTFIRQIEMFSPLHDIGKVGIPDDVLRAPRKLSDEEFDLMKTHSDLGYRILTGKSSLEMAANIAHFHHERHDGSGYPLSIAGGSIPIEARITALADVYDALTTERPYKSAWSHNEAKELIESESGIHFDPLVVEAFTATHEDFARTSRELQ